MNFFDYLFQDLVVLCYFILLGVLLRWALNAAYSAHRRRKNRKAEMVHHMALVTRLAWMVIDATPSKVFYVTKDQMDATPEQAYLKLELTPNGYALKSAETPDPSAHRHITVGS